MRKDDTISISQAWSEPFEEILKKLHVDVEKGLEKQQIRKRLKQLGLNRLRQVKKKNIRQILLNQFKSIIVLIG